MARSDVPAALAQAVWDDLRRDGRRPRRRRFLRHVVETAVGPMQVPASDRAQDVPTHVEMADGVALAVSVLDSFTVRGDEARRTPAPTQAPPPAPSPVSGAADPSPIAGRGLLGRVRTRLSQRSRR